MRLTEMKQRSSIHESASATRVLERSTNSHSAGGRGRNECASRRALIAARFVMMVVALVLSGESTGQPMEWRIGALQLEATTSLSMYDSHRGRVVVLQSDGRVLEWDRVV